MLNLPVILRLTETFSTRRHAVGPFIDIHQPGVVAMITATKVEYVITLQPDGYGSGIIGLQASSFSD